MRSVDPNKGDPGANWLRWVPVVLAFATFAMLGVSMGSRRARTAFEERDPCRTPGASLMEYDSEPRALAPAPSRQCLVDELIAWLGSSEQGRREEAQGMLRGLDVPPLLALYRATRSGSSRQAEAARNLLDEIGPFELRINCGAIGKEAFKDPRGKVWYPDIGVPGLFTRHGGKVVDRGMHVEIDGTRLDRVYATERYGESRYEICVPNGRYQVTLHFAETFPGTSRAGQRVYDVMLQGKLVLHGLDPFREAGSRRNFAVARSMLTEATEKRIVIAFASSEPRCTPMVNGIEVIRVFAEQPRLRAAIRELRRVPGYVPPPGRPLDTILADEGPVAFDEF